MTQQHYEEDRDYRSYVVTDSDAPFVQTGAAARTLGYRSTQSVLNLIRRGALPAKHSTGDQPVWQIPAWAVSGRARLRANDGGASAAEVTSLRAEVQRLRGVNDALIRGSRHEEAAVRALQTYAQEMTEAALSYKEAVVSQLVPDFVTE